MADIESTAAATAMREHPARGNDPRAQAADAAMRYDAPPIARLTIDETRALVASVSWTQSGGDPAAENRFGFAGQYMLTPGQLARAGLVDSGRLSEAMDGHRSEWSWASAGGARQFLADPANWRDGLDLGRYRGSESLQNASFHAYCNQAYQSATERGVLDGGEKPMLLAGYLKVHTVMGEGPADSAIGGGRKFEPPGRDSNYRLLHHLSRGLDGMEPYLAAAVERAQGGAQQGSAPNLLLNDPQHPDRTRFELARGMVAEQFGLRGQALDNAAGVAALQAREAGLDRFGEILKTDRGAWVIDTHRDDPAHHRFVFDAEKAAGVPLAETSRQHNQVFGVGGAAGTTLTAGHDLDQQALEAIRRGPAV